jgi:hypothetical protein
VGRNGVVGAFKPSTGGFVLPVVCVLLGVLPVVRGLDVVWAHALDVGG